VFSEDWDLNRLGAVQKLFCMIRGELEAVKSQLKDRVSCLWTTCKVWRVELIDQGPEDISRVGMPRRRLSFWYPDQVFLDCFEKVRVRIHGAPMAIAMKDFPWR